MDELRILLDSWQSGNKSEFYEAVKSGKITATDLDLALSCAIVRKDEELVQLLLDSGASPNSDVSFWLMLAPEPVDPENSLACVPTASGTSGEVLRLLLSKGLKLDAGMWGTLMHLAITSGKGLEDILSVADEESLMKLDFTGRSALHYAASLADVQSLTRLIAAGADPNHLDDAGMSPLRICCDLMADASLRERSKECITRLLEAGADPTMGLDPPGSDLNPSE